jgi:hypothetical protein
MCGKALPKLSDKFDQPDSSENFTVFAGMNGAKSSMKVHAHNAGDEMFATWM